MYSLIKLTCIILPLILDKCCISDTSGGKAAIFSLTAASLEAECSKSHKRFTNSSA